MNLRQTKIGIPGSKTTPEKLNAWNDRARARRAAEPYARSVDPRSIQVNDRRWVSARAKNTHR